MQKCELRVGPAGWSYDDWKGIVYPSPRPAGFHEAEYLARYFPVLEINTSFYRPLRPEVARVWARKMQPFPRFQFTAKLYRGFTHEGRVERGDIHAFSEGLAPLENAGLLGCLLMQFPWSFRFHRENRFFLLRLKRAFRRYPLVAEFRHASWNCDEALDFLAENGIGFCNIDQPQLNQCLPPTGYSTSEVGYIRLHGRNYQEWFPPSGPDVRRDGLSAIQARYNYLYSPDQLEKWRRRIEHVAKQSRTTFVVTNNHFQGKAVVNALQLLSSLSGLPVDAPPPLVRYYPELASSVRNQPEQRSLFEAAPPPRPMRWSEAAAPRPPLAAVYARG